MTTVTITVSDAGDRVEMEGRIDPPEAINDAPTAALIIGSYLAAKGEKVMQDAMRWYHDTVAAPPAKVEDAPLIITDARGSTV